MANTQIDKICLVCSKVFFVYPYRKDAAKYCSHKCYSTTICKQKKSDYWYEVMHNKIPWNKGKKGWNIGTNAGFQIGNKLQIGENNVNWKGGITPIAKQIRNSQMYKDWRLSIFKRDNFTCQICNLSKSNELNVDHYPKTFAEIVHKNNIKSIADAINCKELWDINSNRTLCINCHKNTPTYLNRWKYLNKKDK